jgi:DNA-binding NtrC family response regulator
MRKRRVMIFDDDPSIQSLFRDFFSYSGYDVMACGEPTVCPLYAQDEESCPQQHPCADVLITDYKMPRINGLELLELQAAQGCKLTSRNKALLSGSINEETVEATRALRCAFFHKPVDLDKLEEWIDECEQRIDLSRPLADRRKEERRAFPDLRFQLGAGSDTLECSGLNSSPNGFCILSPVPLEPKQIVRVAATDSGAPRSALVRWIRKQEDGSYLMGLTCC